MLPTLKPFQVQGNIHHPVSTNQQKSKSNSKPQGAKKSVNKIVASSDISTDLETRLYQSNQEYRELEKNFGSFKFKYAHLESLLLQTNVVLQAKNDEIAVLKHTISSHVSGVQAHEKGLEKIVASQKIKIQELERRNQLLEESLNDALKRNAADFSFYDEQNGGLDKSMATQPFQKSFKVVEHDEISENRVLDTSIISESRPGELVDETDDFHNGVFEQQKQEIKKVLLEHDPIGLLNEAKTIGVDTIYRSESKDIIVQSVREVFKDEEANGNPSQSVEDNSTTLSILKPPRTSSPSKIKSTSVAKVRRVEANPSINTLPEALNPPPLYPERQNINLNQSAISYQDILAANDRYLNRVLAPDWKVEEDDRNLDLDRAFSPTRSNETRSPSPTKSVLLRERDALEEELLAQYEHLRELLQQRG